MKVYVFPEGDPADPDNFVAPIRLLDPLRALAANYGLRFLQHRLDTRGELLDADLVIVQRACFPTLRELDHGMRLLAGARRAGVRIIYELDDHIFCPNLPELIAQSAIDELDEEAYELTQAHQEIFGLADYLTCPTEPLAEALRSVAPEVPVRVIPTRLDFAAARWRVRPVRPDDEEIRIGWCGGSRVGSDLEIMIPALVEITRRRPDVTVTIAGALKYAPLFSELPPHQLRFLDWAPYEQYPSLLAEFDLALIPMQDHEYNRCKSALKVVDYGAVGIRTLCSPVAPFSDFTELDGTPTLVADDQWEESIDLALEATGVPDPVGPLAHAMRCEYSLRAHLADHWRALTEMAQPTFEEARR